MAASFDMVVTFSLDDSSSAATKAVDEALSLPQVGTATRAEVQIGQAVLGQKLIALGQALQGLPGNATLDSLFIAVHP